MGRTIAAKPADAVDLVYQAVPDDAAWHDSGRDLAPKKARLFVIC